MRYIYNDMTYHLSQVVMIKSQSSKVKRYHVMCHLSLYVCTVCTYTYVPYSCWYLVSYHIISYDTTYDMSIFQHMIHTVHMIRTRTVIYDTQIIRYVPYHPYGGHHIMYVYRYVPYDYRYHMIS